MKKIISILTLTVIMFTLCTVNVFAASNLTLSSSVSAAATGEEIILSTILDTSNGLKAVGFKITFDTNDFELGISTESKAAADAYADYIGTPEFPTLDDVTNTLLGRASYVDDAYYNAYNGYATTKKFDSATMGGYEAKDGVGYITFGYASEKAKNALNKQDSMSVGGAVLKVKTTEKKEATITLTSATYAGTDGVDTPCVTNEVKIALNGYGEGEEVFAAIEQSKEGTNTVLTVWGKNTSGAELAAGDYGAVIGGQKFLGGLGSKIGGKDEAVPAADGKWVIKVVDDLGTVFTANSKFDWSAFYVDATGTHTVGSGTYTIAE